MTNEQRSQLGVEEYSEWLRRDNDGFSFSATATINGCRYEVSTETEGEEQLVRDTLLALLAKAKRAKLD